MNSRHKKYFGVAEAISATSTFKRVRIGACIVKNKIVTAVGVNSVKTHPLQLKYNELRFNHKVNWAYLHAEMCAISRCKESLEGADIFVFRRDLKGRLAMARPCPACMGAIIDKGIRNIYYTTGYGYAHEVIDNETRT